NTGGCWGKGRNRRRRQPRPGLRGDMLLQHLDETRFANTRLAAEQYHLPEAVLDLRPALPQERDFLLPPHQRRPPGATGGFQATAGYALIEHAIDRQRRGLGFERGGGEGVGA